MENNTNNPDIIHDINGKNNKSFLSLPVFFFILILAIGLGIGTGYIIKSLSPSTQKETSSQSGSKKTAGIANKETFKDKAEGILKEGGIDGEGNFHLERPGGKSQNVYLTSTTVDLSDFVGKKVRVWGETFQAEKAGWLMDVGLVETLQ